MAATARAGIVAAALALAACGGTLSPLRNHAQVGRDAYLIFLGDGPGESSDLYGVRGDGGPVFQITYTNLAESHPSLSPDGGQLAFLRARSPRDTVPAAIWVMNLLTGAERRLELPKGASAPEVLGWRADGRAIYLRAGPDIWRLAAPPAAPAPQRVAGPERLAADSSLGIFLGSPPFARVVACGGSLCAESGTGRAVPFANDARDPVRWGADSVAYVSGENVVVRPVGPGRAHAVRWSGAPTNPRQPTFFEGKN